MRTRILAPLFGLLALLAATASLPAPVQAAPDDVQMDAATKKATAKALQWLAEKQNADGSWGESRYPHNTAITGFALLAFMSQGHVPGQGLHGPEVAKGCRFLLASSRESDGYLVGARGGNMYCHGMATLALSQLWGMTGDEEIKPVLKKAITLIVGCQSREGGWRYQPNENGADISVTIMQVMALRAAKNAGLHVPDATLRKALDYIKRCEDPRTGGYNYQPNSGAPGFARTAAGACVLQLCGEYEAKQIPKAIAYLKNNANERHHWFYAQYYASHAMHTVGGKEWAAWYSTTVKQLRDKQEGDGSWTGRDLDHSAPGPIYCTSIAVMVMSVPAHYLPIYQR